MKARSDSCSVRAAMLALLVAACLPFAGICRVCPGASGSGYKNGMQSFKNSESCPAISPPLAADIRRTLRMDGLAVCLKEQG